MSHINYAFRGESETLDQRTRAGLPGEFIQLSDGIVHYELAGPPDGAAVVLVHGFSVPAYIWDSTFTTLTQAGMRVLRYDLFGRGFSDRPLEDYSLNLFTRQLKELINQLGLHQPLAIAGVSMGGPIAAGFAVQNPHAVRKLCLIDPAGFITLKSISTMLIKTPWLGEFLLDRWGNKVLVDGVTGDFYRPDRFPEYREKYRPQMVYRGFKRALLSTMRQGMVEAQTALYQQLALSHIPILVFWGKFDQTFPVQTTQRVSEILPQAEIQIVDEAGHAAHYEQPEQVISKMVDFFNH